jgi:hypothetical protein
MHSLLAYITLTSHMWHTMHTLKQTPTDLKSHIIAVHKKILHKEQASIIYLYTVLWYKKYIKFCLSTRGRREVNCTRIFCFIIPMKLFTNFFVYRTLHSQVFTSVRAYTITLRTATVKTWNAALQNQIWHIYICLALDLACRLLTLRPPAPRISLIIWINLNTSFAVV